MPSRRGPRLTTHKRDQRAGSRGQALIELALILPILLFLLLGALDLGRAFYSTITVASAAKEAALSASADGAQPDRRGCQRVDRRVRRR